MKELSSYHVYFHQPLTTNQIVNIHKLSTKNKQSVYLHQNHLIADAGHLTKLLSFFLFVNVDEPVLLIIDGENVEDVYEELQSLCTDNISEVNRRTRYSEQIMNSRTSITV
ncbi:hypothetical protein Q7A53_18365 [Halobacillus rhizosphaerae]|uniref:hypothetical protein n=1 Tax=Halobacillus rhizosphaerae TaxID=3064889 RepID=UPI00398ADDBF